MKKENENECIKNKYEYIPESSDKYENTNHNLSQKQNQSDIMAKSCIIENEEHENLTESIYLSDSNKPLEDKVENFIEPQSSDFIFTDDKIFVEFYEKNKPFYEYLRIDYVFLSELIELRETIIEEDKNMEKTINCENLLNTVKHPINIYEIHKLRLNVLIKRKEFILNSKGIKSSLVYLEDRSKSGIELHLCPENCYTLCSGIAIESKLKFPSEILRKNLPDVWIKVNNTKFPSTEGYIIYENIEYRVMHYNGEYFYYTILKRNKNLILSILSKETKDEELRENIRKLENSTSYYHDLIKTLRTVKLELCQYDILSDEFIKLYINDMYNDYKEAFILPINMFFPVLSTYYQNGCLTPIINKAVNDFVESPRIDKDYNIFFKEVYSRSNFRYATRNIKESIISTNQVQLELVSKIFFEKHNSELINQKYNFIKEIQFKLVYLRMLKGNLADIIKLLEHARKSKKKEEELNFELDELLNKKENKRKIDQFKELIERSHKHFEDIDFKSMKQCILF